MADFRAMIARWLRGANDELVKDLAGSAGDAVRLGVKGVGRIIINRLIYSIAQVSRMGQGAGIDLAS